MGIFFSFFLNEMKNEKKSTSCNSSEKRKEECKEREGVKDYPELREEEIKTILRRTRKTN